jgi:hypothetical protein
MSDIVFGRLTDLLPREAWKHEALAFTPWLAENIDQLSAVIGFPLELTGKEMPVEDFAADILARNPEDGTVVLIENQLEVTDHTHLGQIMTYLAGLEAQTVIWIAPRFREPHLSAIRWLNEHTEVGFSFFAVRLRVVRIGDSPLAPVLEVVEKPNDWDRALTEKRREVSGERDPLSDTRLAFWTHYSERSPEAVAAGLKPMRAWNAYFPIGDKAAFVSVYVAQKHVGAYLRPYWSADGQELADKLSPHAADLEAAIGAPLEGKRDHFFRQQRPLEYSDAGQWDTIIDWMESVRRSYASTLQTVLGGEA